MNNSCLYSWIALLTCVAVTPLHASEADAKQSRQSFLKRFDANGDGKVTKDESTAVLEKEAKQRAVTRKADESRRRFFKRFDANGDGKVTKDESRAVLKKEAKQRAVKRKADESRRRFLKRFDANGDGKVTKDESKEVLEKKPSKGQSRGKRMNRVADF
jgi:Ca2+-binding EF-hand superfamily protein